MTSADSPDRIIVTVCTYNERENLQTLIPAIRAQLPQATILIVDDNSPDGTAEVVRSFNSTDPQVQLLLRQQKAGLGAATIAGFQAAMDRGAEFVINMDADWSHPPELLPTLVRLMDAADVAIASRYVRGGGMKNWGWHRYVMSWGINVYSRLMLGLSSRDCSGAYRCYRASKLREIDFARFRSRGYAFQEEILYRCRRVGCRFVETPFVFVDREIGQSKINVKEIFRAVWNIAQLAGDRMLNRPVRKTP